MANPNTNPNQIGKLSKLDSKSATVADSAIAPADERAERILSYHRGGRRAAGQQIVFAYLAGAELLAAKEEIAHGQFTKWCAEFLPDIPERTAQRYMRFAEQLQTEINAISDVDLPRLQLTNGEAQHREIEKVADAIKEVADGKSLTDLYRGFGLIREPKPKENHPRRRTAEELEEEANAAALLDLQTLAGDMETFAANTEAHSRIKTPDLKEALDSALRFTACLRGLIKARGKSKPAKKGKK